MDTTLEKEQLNIITQNINKPIELYPTSLIVINGQSSIGVELLVYFPNSNVMHRYYRQIILTNNQDYHSIDFVNVVNDFELN